MQNTLSIEDIIVGLSSVEHAKQIEVTFDVNKFSELTRIIQSFLDYKSGKVQSMDLKDIQAAISELQRVERVCEEVSKLEAA